MRSSVQRTQQRHQKQQQQQEQQEHKQTTDATNSEADPSDSLLLHSNGKFVHRFLDRFKNSLIGGLLRKSHAFSDSHNSGNQSVPDEANADEPSPNAEGNQEINKKKERKLSDEAVARKRAEKFYTVDTEAYDFKSVLNFYATEDRRILPRAMKFLIERRSRPRPPGAGDAGGFSVHPLLDKVAGEFCRRLGMFEVARLSGCQERIFLWLSRERAHRVLSEIGRRETGEQVYFVNRINLDHVLTDLQCLCGRLGGCVACDGQVYPAHYCTDPDRIREQHQARMGGLGPVPRAIFIDRQTLCQHVYLKQDFGIACEVKSCPNYGKRLCSCFQLDMFIPDTIVLATKRKFEEIRGKLAKKIYGDQRWLIRASNLKGGNGVQLIDTASELETFMRYDLQKKMRGQFFVMQRHLKNPLLLEGKRFDLRMFLLVVVLTDRRVLAFLHPGYLRLAQRDYEAASNDLRCHLTWPFTWDPDYSRYRASSAKASGAGADESPQQQQADDYCRPYVDARESVGLPNLAPDRAVDAALRPAGGGSGGDVGDRFLQRLGRIVHYLAGQVDSLIADKPGSWQLFGLDLQLDADKEVWLHDIMTYPCQGEPDPRSEAQNRVVPAVLTESLTLVLELNQRDCATRSSALWLDLPDVPVNQPGLIAAQKNFVWVYSTDVERLITYKPQRQRSRSPHWYQQWRVAEDLNDYVLYLKNYRINSFPLENNTTLYGRKSFEHSPAEKFRRMMVKEARQSNERKSKVTTPEKSEGEVDE